MTHQIQEQNISHRDLYEQDFYLWIEQAANLLRHKNLKELDLENLIEEIENMGRSEKRTVNNNLRILLMHLFKYKYQPEKRSNSWQYTIIEHRQKLQEALQDSPSLNRYFAAEFNDCYTAARKLTAIETNIDIDTFPITAPFTASQVLDEDYLLDWIRLDALAINRV